MCITICTMDICTFAPPKQYKFRIWPVTAALDEHVLKSADAPLVVSLYGREKREYGVYAKSISHQFTLTLIMGYN